MSLKTCKVLIISIIASIALMSFNQTETQIVINETKDSAWVSIDSQLTNIEQQRYHNMQSKKVSFDTDAKLIKELKLIKKQNIAYADLGRRCDSMLNYYKFMYTWR